MTASTKRKTKKWMLWSIIGILVLAIAAAAIFMPKGTGAFQAEVAKTGNITTYSNFPGIIDTQNRETVISEKPMQICDIKVKQGDQVKNGDVLMVTSLGENIKATINGEVSNIRIKKNTQVNAGMEMMKIVDYKNYKTNVKVDEFSFRFLETGQKVNVSINALGKELGGTISDISKEAVNENGVSYFMVAMDLQRDSDLRIGMSTEAKIVKDEALAVTTLPMDVILFDDENEPYVLLPSEEGEPKEKAITTGINDGMIVEVVSGVSAGESVMYSTGEEGLLEELFWR
ncbi:HlyD family efflux transporter periplasmic adaptor subunit [Planococcus sp. N064]|uniref:HlyD family efflux transporter periplasmic adaptor subunit n=1 Tax=Planococcus liqunii TaxID=3058394 RepID=A0ABT8MTF6_9BACL|nr:HlyD family efflux transporter periplasmic adaptor subunit [Planococcus sp. N064]MDN7228192.1 HlyD family efflux transporter periplasmic adaptor subunit [Planococcus sp. N064]